MQPENFRFCCQSYTYKNVQGAKEVFSIYIFLAEAPCHLKSIQLSSKFSSYEEAAWFFLSNKYLIYHENAILLMNTKSACNIHLIEKHLFIIFLLMSSMTSYRKSRDFNYFKKRTKELEGKKKIKKYFIKTTFR